MREIYWLAEDMLGYREELYFKLVGTVGEVVA
jgi:hypothetical protein